MILVHPLIDPVILSFGVLQVRWYGLAYVIGFILGYYLIKLINKRSAKPLNNKIIDDFFIWSIIGIIIGGRLGYIIFYQTTSIFSDPLNILFIWKGGMSFHGGLLGIIFSIFFYTKKNNINYYKISDLVCAVAPIGIFLGRIANFINTELYGRVTNHYIAIIYPNIDNLPRHPSQLYEAFFEGIILFLVLWIVREKKINKNANGLITGIFLLLYGSFRFLLEFLREPDSHLGLFFELFSMGQLLSIPLIVFGLFIIAKKNKI